MHIPGCIRRRSACSAQGAYPVPTAAPKASPLLYCFSVARGGPEMVSWQSHIPHSLTHLNQLKSLKPRLPGYLKFETYLKHIWNIVKGGEMCEVSIRLVTSHSLGLHVHATPERNWYLWLQWVPWRTSHGLWRTSSLCCAPCVVLYCSILF